MAFPTLTGRTPAAAIPLLLLANCGGSHVLPQLAAARPAALSDACESLPAKLTNLANTRITGVIAHVWVGEP